MSLALRKVLSFLVVCLAALGIIISLFLLIQVWRYRQPAVDKLQYGVGQISSVLQITDDGLVVIDQVVKNVYTSTTYLDEATLAFSQTILTTGQFMDSAGTFVGDDLITTITNTQTALGSAEASAKVIDNILSTLARVPLIGITYNPGTPLNTALGEVSSSLDPLQNTLKGFQANLRATRSNMQVFSSQINSLNKNIQDIQENLTRAQATITKYRSQITTLMTWLTDVKTNLPTWMTILAWLLTLIIIWLIIIQVSLLLHELTQIIGPHPGTNIPEQLK